ncbi:hypothetical protein EFL95_05425 [Nocardioides marmorisolisilvae]|uniref:Uncharacterized protein n=1 Tax=Nocardioides marmorisolisilvae TaxID=1542737 RepID=A0A3N0DSC9_9ACTN|nr:hypothetical protein EFL95_05425 [Nocardioides marmorisolisilvae]
MALAIFISLAVAPGAFAVGSGTACTHGGNYGSVKCVNGQNNERFYGAFDDFVDVALEASGASSSNPVHTNQAMWLYTHSDGSQWVELGIRRGYWVPCSCVKYTRYWAEFTSSGAEMRHTLTTPAAPNGEHTYEILRSTSDHTRWNVYVDYNLKGQATYQNSATGYEIENGLETTALNTTTSSGLANHSPLEYMNAAGAFVHYSYERHWRDQPCSGTSTGATCMTGYATGEYDVWKAAKG